MIGERENINSNTDYGALVMRPYDIAGNEISAFYDNADNLVFVLDNTVSNKKTNVLLVINPEAGKRWDEILSGKYGVDLETIRPKVDNKYQKLDIEYSGLYVYDNLISAYNAGDDLGDSLEQLEILRDSAVRNSAMVRLTTANDTISKTNITIAKTKESIVKLQNRVKTLRAKLSEAKKEIGRVATKQSASKILKLESQIDAANEKIKRSKKRLESAQKRLEMATVDAELATELLNQPTVVKSKTISAPLTTIKEPEIQTMPEMLGGDDYEEDESDRDDYVEESADTSVDDVKPLFDTDPQILNEDIAFKPIEFAAPAFSDITMKEPAPEAPALDTQQENQSVLESMRPVTEQENSITQENDLMFQPVGVPEISEEKSALEVLPPVAEQNVQTVPEDMFLPQPVVEPEFVDKMSDFETLNPVNNQNIETSEDVVATPEPVAPTVQYKNELDYAKAKEHTKNGPLYYVLLFVLIILSVFTLWLYQKHMATDSTPVLTAKTAESSVVSQSAMDEEENVVTTSTVEEPIDDEFYESAFIEEVATQQESEPKQEQVATETNDLVEENTNIEHAEPDFVAQETVVDEVPVVMDVIPERLNTVPSDFSEETQMLSEEDVLANKPVYEPGAKGETVFVDEQQEYESDSDEYYDDNLFYDTEETEYVDE